MRDDDEAGSKAVDEALQQVEPGEVEVVRRLVEQEDVEAREQDRRQPRPRALSAGDRPERPVEQRGEPDLGARSRARASKSAPPRARKRSSASV